MKKRNLFLGVFLVLAVLFLGIGYAALSNSLSINGTINSEANDANLVVDFDREYTPYSEVSDNRIGVNSQRKSPKEVSIAVSGFSTEGDSAVIYFKIINNSNEIESYDALLSNFTINMTHGATPESAVTANGSQTGNEYTGEHFIVNVEYVESYHDKSLNQDVNASANLEYSEGQPVLKAVGHEYVFVKVTIQVKDDMAITTTLDPHYFTIRFTASTLD